MEKFHPQRILCPTDFSEMASLALQHASSLATCFSAELLVIYADPLLPPPYFTAGGEEDLARSLRQSEKAAGEHLARYAKEHIGGAVPYETLFVNRLAVPAIVETAEKNKADMIVMGTYGRSGLSRVLMGSVAERVLRETSLPVLTVRSKKTDEKKRVSFSRILCPVNYSEVARKALGHALSLAECFSSELQVMNVLENPGGSDQEERDKLCAWVGSDPPPKCNLQPMVSHGNAAEQIIQAASSWSADLVIIGARHKRFADTTILGSTTVRVTRHAPCPVLTTISS